MQYISCNLPIKLKSTTNAVCTLNDYHKRLCLQGRPTSPTTVLPCYTQTEMSFYLLSCTVSIWYNMWSVLTLIT